MKKRFKFGLILAAAALTAAGCGNNSASVEPADTAETASTASTENAGSFSTSVSADLPEENHAFDVESDISWEVEKSERYELMRDQGFSQYSVSVAFTNTSENYKILNAALKYGVRDDVSDDQAYAFIESYRWTAIDGIEGRDDLVCNFESEDAMNPGESSKSKAAYESDLFDLTELKTVSVLYADNEENVYYVEYDCQEGDYVSNSEQRNGKWNEWFSGSLGQKLPEPSGVNYLTYENEDGTSGFEAYDCVDSSLDSYVYKCMENGFYSAYDGAWGETQFEGINDNGDSILVSYDSATNVLAVTITGAAEEDSSGESTSESAEEAYEE